ncbi:MAG: hypothetical protein ACRC8A_01935 [Microcoleaceae cyanobacterium]
MLSVYFNGGGCKLNLQVRQAALSRKGEVNLNTNPDNMPFF